MAGSKQSRPEDQRIRGFCFATGKKREEKKGKKQRQRKRLRQLKDVSVLEEDVCFVA